MSSYNEQKKRRIEKISENYDHVPTKKDVVLMLIGEDKHRPAARPPLGPGAIEHRHLQEGRSEAYYSVEEG